MEELYDVLIAGKMGSKAGFKPTEEQLEAMNSGINAEKVAQIETNEDNISVLQNNVENVDEKVANVSDVVGAIIAHGTQSWDTVQAIVRAGLGPVYYPVGTLLYDNWNETTGTAFRVVGYDVYFDDTLTTQGYTHSMLLYEEAIDKQMQFDAAEAWLYAEQAIPAGTYRFTIPDYDTAYGGNKTYIFTSTVDVPVGGQLTLIWAYQQLPSKVQGYTSSTATTALFDVNIAEWNGTDACIDLGTIKLTANDADSQYGKLNHIQRARYGSNNYYQSGLRQYLNTTIASDWWQPTNIFDRPYAHRNNPGRLTNFDADFVAKLAAPQITCITNNVFEYGDIDGVPFELQTAYTVKEKMFLLTHTELNLSATPNVGNVLPYYVGADNTKRIKRLKSNNDAAPYWLRTCLTNAANERRVNTNGERDYDLSMNTGGVAAACVIQ